MLKVVVIGDQLTYLEAPFYINIHDTVLTTL